jgi:predicted MFS family arabinose efflux permease
VTTQVDVLRSPHVPRLLASNLVGRIPSAIAALAASLVMREAGISFDVIGVAVGAFALGLAIGGPVLGRIVDRLGQPQVLVIASVVAAAAFVSVDLAGTRWGLIVVAMLVAGFTTPPLEPCLRALWPDLVEDDQLDAALSLDAAVQEIVFIVGPMLVAVSAALLGPSSAVWLAAGLGVLGAIVFARSAPSRGWRPTEAERHWRGPLDNGGIVLLFGCLFFFGAAIGALTITVVSYAEQESVWGGAGGLLATNAVGALAGAVLYGAVVWRYSYRRRLLVCSLGMAATYLWLVAVPGPGLMVVVMFATGFFLAPLLAVSFSMVGRLSKAHYVTEAFAWLVTLFTIGNAVGSPVAGLATESNLSAAAGVAAAATCLGAVVAISGQRSWRTVDAAR